VQFAVAIVDDQTLFAEGLASTILLALPHFRVVGKYSSAKTAIEGVLATRPGIVVLDLNLENNETGFDVHRALVGALPETRWIACTSINDAATVTRCVALGFNAVVHKSSDTTSLISALKAAVAGGFLLCPTATSAINGGGRVILTDTERAVLDLLNCGFSQAEITAHCGYSDRTVRRCLESMRDKFSVKSNEQLLAEAHRRGFFLK
jgi:DNA-binding NarL/FixJ family response regulator